MFHRPVCERDMHGKCAHDERKAFFRVGRSGGLDEVGRGASFRSGMGGSRFSVAELGINGGDRTVDQKKLEKRTLDDHFRMFHVLCEPPRMS